MKLPSAVVSLIIVYFFHVFHYLMKITLFFFKIDIIPGLVFGGKGT